MLLLLFIPLTCALKLQNARDTGDTLFDKPVNSVELEKAGATYDEECGNRNNYRCWKKGGHSTGSKKKNAAVAAASAAAAPAAEDEAAEAPQAPAAPAAPATPAAPAGGSCDCCDTCGDGCWSCGSCGSCIPYYDQKHYGGMGRYRIGPDGMPGYYDFQPPPGMGPPAAPMGDPDHPMYFHGMSPEGMRDAMMGGGGMGHPDTAAPPYGGGMAPGDTGYGPGGGMSAPPGMGGHHSGRYMFPDGHAVPITYDADGRFEVPEGGDAAWGAYNRGLADSGLQKYDKPFGPGQNPDNAAWDAYNRGYGEGWNSSH